MSNYLNMVYISFSAHQAPSEKGSNLKGKNEGEAPLSVVNVLKFHKPKLLIK